MSDLSLGLGDRVEFRIGVYPGNPLGSLITGTITEKMAPGPWWVIQSDALCDYHVHRDSIEEKL